MSDEEKFAEAASRFSGVCRSVMDRINAVEAAAGLEDLPAVYRYLAHIPWALLWDLKAKGRIDDMPEEPRVDSAATALNSVKLVMDLFQEWMAAQPEEGGDKRRCHERDHTFLRWKREGMGVAAIRDRWNKEHPEDGVGKLEGGRDRVKKGIAAALRDEELSKISPVSPVISPVVPG